MSKFDFDLFTEDCPIVAVSKERYTEQQAEEIAKNELGVNAVEKREGFVRYGYGCDDDGEVRNTWWLYWHPRNRSCPVWAFESKKEEA